MQRRYGLRGMAGDLGSKGGINAPIRPGKSSGVTITPIHRERWQGTVGGVSKEMGYEQEHEQEQGDDSHDSSSNSSTSISKRLDGRWNGTSSFPFDRGKTHGALPRHVLSSVASLDTEYVGLVD